MIIAYFLFNSSLIYLADCLHVNYEQLILWLVGIYSHIWARQTLAPANIIFTLRSE